MEYVIKVFIISPYWTETKQLQESLGNVEDIEIAGEANKYDSALIKINESRPHVILIEESLEENCYQLAAEITEKFIEASVIILGENPPEDNYRKMLQAGVRDFIKKPVDPAALVEAIYSAYESGKKKKEILPGLPATEESSNRKTKVITVFSTKGGVGKTTIAVNLAVSLAQNYTGRTLLWDLDLHNGLVAPATNIAQRRHITDMLSEMEYLDGELLEGYLERHESKLRILPAPFTPEFADFVSEEHVNKILEVAREKWDYIVIDTPPLFSAPTIEALKLADIILLIGSPDLGAIKNLKAALVVMNKLNFSRARMKLVLNHAGKEFGVTPKDVEDTLYMPVFATVPSDAKNVITGLNQGVPPAFGAPGSDFSSSIKLLARAVSGARAVEAPAEKKKGLLKRRLTRKTPVVGG